MIFGGDNLGPGSAGVREPRTPRPQRGSDGVELPEPRDSEPSESPGQQPPDQQGGHSHARADSRIGSVAIRTGRGPELARWR
jgi:hypothetical protein